MKYLLTLACLFCISLFGCKEKPVVKVVTRDVRKVLYEDTKGLDYETGRMIEAYWQDFAHHTDMNAKLYGDSIYVFKYNDTLFFFERKGSPRWYRLNTPRKGDINVETNIGTINGEFIVGDKITNK